MKTDTQLTPTFLDDYLLTWIDGFLIDRKARGTSKATIRFYELQLRYFVNFCDTQAVKGIAQIRPNLLRDYLLVLETTGHNAGERHAAFLLRFRACLENRHALKCACYWVREC